MLLRAKCILVGDSCVGKSAIAHTFHSDGTHFPKAYTMVMIYQVPRFLCILSVYYKGAGPAMDLIRCYCCHFLFCLQTTGVELCVKTISLPDSRDSVVSTLFPSPSTTTHHQISSREIPALQTLPCHHHLQHHHQSHYHT